MIVDGISWNILINDLTSCYFRLKSGKEIDLIRPYPYKYWVNDVKELANNISGGEKQHWIEVNGMLDGNLIKGKSKVFSFEIDAKYHVDNLLMLSEEEYLILAMARAYKKTYGQSLIFNRESHGREDSLAEVNRTVGWFTSQYPVTVDVTNEYDDISIVKDAYNVKIALNDVENLGLNYGSLIYDALEFEYKHCPVSFNFLSTEFSFENELFESFNVHIANDLDGKDMGDTYGVTFNIYREDDNYIIVGDYAKGTYIGDKFKTFIVNIEFELEYIAELFSADNIVCALSESQLGVYLDEKVHDKGTAYSAPGIFDCGNDRSIGEIEDAIHVLINKHPVLKGRVLDDDIPLLVCDSYPSIEIVDVENYLELIKPFDLEKSLARFFIIDNDEHRFIFYDIHHIINDATSLRIIQEELNGILNGEYDDSIDWGFVYASEDSFEFKFKAEYDSAYNFFSEELADIDNIPSLLDDVDGSEGSVILPIRGIRSQVELYAHKMGISVNNLLIATFAYAYSRFVGSDEVYFTFTENGRHDAYNQNSLGMFVRTVPVIIDCKDKSIRDYITSVSDLILKSLSNSIYPFRALASEFNLNNDVTFEYNHDLNDMSNIGDDIVFRDNTDRVSELLCVVNNLDDGYVVNVNHLDRYSQNTAKRLACVFKEVLIQFLEKEELHDIEYISEDDVKLLVEYNKTEEVFEHEDILSAFNENLSKYEDNILVGYENNYYTHGEGTFIANEIANRLSNLGVSKQDFVALFVERSEWMLLASMGVLTNANIYVPIETNYPNERIVLMLKDTASKVVIVDENTQKDMEDIIARNELDIDVLNVSDIPVKSSNHLNVVEVDENDGACVLYTSGTTGIPKGVLVTRKSLNNFVSWYVKETEFTAEDVYGMHCSYVFDMHAHALYSPVITGGSLYVVPEDIRLDLKALNDYFVKHKCTHTYITSQVGKLFAESGMQTTIKLLCFGGMKLGELNAPDSMGPFESYGPSENLAISTSIFANKRMHSSSIGRFISNVKGYVLDSEHRRVPLGGVGELYLSGYQLTPGYFNRENENENAFFDNPFDDKKGYERIYKTGDMVRFLPDGTLAIVGRLDSQVKIRGNRVELSEVESTIRSMDEIEDVTVQTIKNEGNNELVAYIVLSKGVKEDDITDYLCEYVASRKPDYMVPSFVITLDEIPLNVNGKVDISALPDVDLDALRSDYVAPRSEAEKIIVAIFEDIFKQDMISINDDFIRLGGDSIMAIRVISSLQKHNLSCSAKDILTYKTPYLISHHVEKDISTESYNPVEGVVDLLPIQSYFFDQVNSNKFSQVFVLKSKFNLDLDTLQDAFDELTNVHDMLRAKYKFENDKIIQSILPLNTRICKIKEHHAADLNESIKEVIDESVDTIDVVGDLIKITLIDYGAESYLVFVIHHLIIDGVSWNILLDDLSYIYTQILKGEEINLLRPYPYKLWVNDVKKLAGSISDNEKQHWIEIDGLLDDSKIKGQSKSFTFEVDLSFMRDIEEPCSLRLFF